MEDITFLIGNNMFLVLKSGGKPYASYHDKKNPAIMKPAGVSKPKIQLKTQFGVMNLSVLELKALLALSVDERLLAEISQREKIEWQE